MATYQDFNKVIKETVQVEADPLKRWTPQVVRFINHNNQFYGSFTGKISAECISASGAELNNVKLSNCVIYDSKGNPIHLSAIAGDIIEIKGNISSTTSNLSSLSAEFIQLSNFTYIDVPQKINAVCAYVDNVSAVLCSMIPGGYETYASRQELAHVSSYISGEVVSLSTSIIPRIDDLEGAIEEHEGLISEISGKIKGGIAYQGIVTTNRSLSPTVSALLMTNDRFKEDTVVRQGFVFAVSGHKSTFEESITIGQGDYIFINIEKTKSYSSCKVCEITKDMIDVLDAMDEKVYTLIQSISSDVDGLKTISANINERLITAEGDISGLKTISANIDSRVTATEGDISGLKTISANIDSRLTTTEGDISGLKTISSDINGRLVVAEGDIAGLKTISVDIDGRLNSVEGDVSSLKTISASLDARITATEEDINGLKVISSNIDERLAAAESDIGGLKTISANLDTRLTTTEGDVAGLKTISSDFDSKIKSAQEDISGLKAISANIDSRLSGAESDIFGLKTISVSLDSRITTTENDIDGLKTISADIDGRLTTAESDIGGLKIISADIDQRLNSTIENVGVISSSVETLNSQISDCVSYQGTVNTAEVETKGDYTVSSLLLTYNGYTEDTYLKHSFLYQNLGHRVVLENTLSVWNKDLVFIDIKQHGGAIQIKNITKDHVKIFGEVDKDIILGISASISSLQSNINSIEGRIDGLQEISAQLSGMIENLNATVYGISCDLQEIKSWMSSNTIVVTTSK